MRHVMLAAAAATTLAAMAVPALAQSRTFELDAFTAIDIGSGLDAVVTVGPAQSVVASSTRQEELDELMIEVRDGRLRAWADWDILDLFDWAGSDRRTTITINVPALDAVSASSGADVDVGGLAGERLALDASSGADLTVRGAAGGRFELESSSGADLKVDGTCDEADVRSSSGADLEAENLVCATVHAEVSSGASAEVHATTTLRAKVSSGGELEVSGRPASVEQEVSSGGSIDID